MKRIFITGNRDKKGCLQAAEDIQNYLKGKSEVIGVDLNRDIHIPKGGVDLVICLGGDGSLLNLARFLIDQEVPVMGINFGRMGFLTAGLAKDMTMLLDAYLEGRVEVCERMVLELHQNEQKSKHLLINDIVVCSLDLGRVFSLRASINQEKLFSMRGDGLIISSPTGSTAHSLSAGGSIVDPKLEAILLSPLGSQNLSSRPLVIAPDETIEIELLGGCSEAKILGDGRLLSKLIKGEKIKISRSDKKLKMVQPENFKFYQRLREKLGWNLNTDKEEE